MRLFCLTVTLIKKLPVPTKRATTILIKVKSYTTLLRKLPVYISGYLKSHLTYKFLISDNYHLDTKFTFFLLLHRAF
jgi:hypothetical protein